MSWETDLFCTISFMRETYNSLYEVQDAIKEQEKIIEDAKATLKELALMTEPGKFFTDPESSPYFEVKREVDECLENIQDATVENYKLGLLEYNWDKCHNKEGRAINPPEGIKWDTAYLDGDFVKGDKRQDIEDELMPSKD